MSSSDPTFEEFRAKLNLLSFPEVQKEARRYGIKLSTLGREKWIDAILNHVTRSDAVYEEEQIQKTRGAADSMAFPAPEASQSFNLMVNQMQLQREQMQLQREQMQLQREQMQLQREQMTQQKDFLQQLAQQQAMMQQMFMTLNINSMQLRGSSSASSHNDSHHLHNQNNNSVPDSTIAATGQSIEYKICKGDGYTRAITLSPELAAVVGAKQMARDEVLKKVWSIVKERNLYDPKNKEFAICDEELMKVIGVKRFRTFGVIKYLKSHFVD